MERNIIKLNKNQKTALLDLMRDRPLLRSGKFTDSFTHKEAQRQWTEIAEMLNAIPGCQKDWRNWRKTWQNLQNKTKTKSATIARSARQTGGGPPPEPLNDFEEGLASLINANSIVGHNDGVGESLVEVFVVVDPEENQSEAGTGNDPVVPPPLEPTSTGAQQQDVAQQSQTQDVTVAETSRKTKVHMKSLLKDKIELKKKLVDATISFYSEFLKTQRQQVAVLQDLSNQLSLANRSRNNE